MTRLGRWIPRAVLTAGAVVALVLSGVPLLGGFAAALPVIGPFGRFVIPYFPQIGALALAATILATFAAFLGGGRVVRGVLLAAGIATIGWSIVFTAFNGLATAEVGSYSLKRQVEPRDGQIAPPSEHLVYATVDGQELHVDVRYAYPFLARTGPAPFGSGEGGPPAVLFVHGGGFWSGGLGERDALLTRFSTFGYPTFDVEYRLSPPARWDQAPGDVLCALGWVQANAAKYGFDPRRVVMVGESAGGNLALLAAWAAGEQRITPSCLYPTLPPRAVIAISPTVDLAGIWADGTLSKDGVRFPEDYIGGTPAQFPERYTASSPVALVRTIGPATLVVLAANDSLVRTNRSTPIVDALRDVNATVDVVTVPFADHGFDGDPNAFGEQLEEELFLLFIADNA
ncbi:MAG TPA: alpha/beta hydrolase [Candidatus Limnocylindrales bacterium]